MHPLSLEELADQAGYVSRLREKKTGGEGSSTRAGWWMDRRTGAHINGPFRKRAAPVRRSGVNEG
jgi:hypothetical protein